MSLLDIFGVLANYLLNASPANMLASAKFGRKKASGDCRWIVSLQIGKYFGPVLCLFSAGGVFAIEREI